MRGRTMGTGLAVVVGVAAMLAPSALAGQQEDYATIHNDWLPDSVITHCKYTLVQLQNAQTVSQQTAGDSYTDFPSALEVELASVKAGKCSSSGGGTTAAKPGSKLRLTVTPHKAKVGVKTTFKFKVTAPKKKGRGRTSVKNAKIKLGGKSVRTKKNGRAQLKLTFSKAGKRTATATKAGLKTARVKITVKP